MHVHAMVLSVLQKWRIRHALQFLFAIHFNFLLYRLQMLPYFAVLLVKHNYIVVSF